LAYGISKFLGGVLGAKFSSSLMLSGGLLLTALVNFAFGMSSNVQVWAALWFFNGSIQGIGAPASAALLTRWFASKERGTWWGFWNCGANLGGFLTPILGRSLIRCLGL
jgi:OPA family sugar phosphate sensor protein UhpC-like MFS transporter